LNQESQKRNTAPRPRSVELQQRPVSRTGSAPARPVQRPGTAPQQRGAQQRPAQHGSAASAQQRRTTSVKKSASNRAISLLLIIVCVVAVIWYLTSGGKAPAETVSHGVEISEIMTSNKGTVPDETGDFPDWIELHNTTNDTIDIGGFGLSDDALGSVKWTLPVGTKLQANEYLVVFCSGETDRGTYHAPFKISASDVVTLSTESGTIVEQVQCRAVTAGLSLAKDGSGNFAESNPSPGFPNSPDGQAAFLATLTAVSSENPGVYINEFMASNASTAAGPDGSYSDWIELYNATSQTIDLSGYGISDTTTQPLKYVLPEGTSIAPNGVLLIWCTGKMGADPAQPEAPFGLAAYAESVVLASPTGKILDSYDYYRQETDMSMMRSPDGTGDWTTTTQPTPGYLNNSQGLEAFTATLSYGKGDLIISEVLNANYSTLRQPDLSYPDWIEIRNRSANAINLSGYGLSKNAKNPAKWTFPDITLGAGEHIVVLASGKNVTDTQKKNLETNFALSGEGESLFLFSPEGELIDKLQFGRGHRDVSVGRDDTGTLAYYANPSPGAANTGGARGYAAEPIFTVASGVYTSAQSVSIEVPVGCTVRYTVDGSVPTESSTLYSGAISVSNNTVLRARSFSSGLQASDVATASYFIQSGAETMESHATDFAIVSIAIEPDYMFGPVNGIYVAGQRFSEKSEIETDASSFTIDVSARDTNLWAYANFNAQHITHPDPMGLEWERPMHMDLIDENGVLEYEEDAMIRIFGAYSRYEQQKGLAIVTRSGYGTTALNNKFFENRDYTSYQSLTLRPSAMDWKMSKIRDILIQGLLEEHGSILPTQAYRRAIVYVNGRYWGIYNIREKVNKHFLAARYNIDPESIDILVGNGTTEAAQISGTNAYLEYKKLIDWVAANDLTDPSNYAYIQTQVDIENFAEYCAMEVFVGNTDTGNIKFWRSADYDNKWRWIPYDFDWAFNRNDGDSETVTSGYRRNFFEKYFHEKGHGVGKGFSTVLSRGLLRNAEFRALFLQKCAFMYNEVFTSENLLNRINELESEMLSEIQHDTERWSDFSMTNWERSITNLKDSAENAPEYFLKYCQSYFSLSDSDMISLFGKVSSK